MFDTMNVWDNLSLTGRARLTMPACDRALNKQLQDEAAEEGVSLKVDWREAAKGYTVYLYLMKAN